MKTGDVVIVSFPYTDSSSFKARPAVVVNLLEDNYNDVIICLVTSVVPVRLSTYEILLKPDNINNLKVVSIIKVARIATVERDKIKAVIGKLGKQQLEDFKAKFRSLVDEIN